MNIKSKQEETNSKGDRPFRWNFEARRTFDVAVDISSVVRCGCSKLRELKLDFDSDKSLFTQRTKHADQKHIEVIESLLGDRTWPLVLG